MWPALWTITRMELRLGARLLERTTRQVHLTHDGGVLPPVRATARRY